MSYNGWANWDTWVVYLWAGNDADLYQHSQEIMAAMAATEQHRPVAEMYRGQIVAFYRRAADIARFRGDLAEANRIDWNELVDAFLGRYEEYKRELD